MPTNVQQFMKTNNLPAEVFGQLVGISGSCAYHVKSGKVQLPAKAKKSFNKLSRLNKEDLNAATLKARGTIKKARKKKNTPTAAATEQAFEKSVGKILNKSRSAGAMQRGRGRATPTVEVTIMGKVFAGPETVITVALEKAIASLLV